ncbi:hypothetical protein M9H77_13174 [Catharanthus roseus]|uniref:Uncharacterized protein n=1 Tax=Catharanthus roseus TaxID=4058 RepID=A0ACC0BJJ9_CATRO|nr:hypothetical protein M9H77_13174 [Catharanthus roseus]
MEVKIHLRFPCSKCKNKKIIHSKVVREHFLRKYELELQNINSNITENEIQEKISEGSAKWFRNEEKFHEVWRTVEEDVQASASRTSCSHLNGASSEPAHLIVERSRACLDHEHRLMRRVEDAVSKIYATFDEHMRWLFEHSHLVYITFPSMVPLVRVSMSADPSTSLSTAAAAAGTPSCRSEILVLPSIHAPRPTSPLLDHMDGAPPSSRDAIKAFRLFVHIDGCLYF